ncbi:unnamed protein product [Linum trigynum]
MSMSGGRWTRRVVDDLMRGRGRGGWASGVAEIAGVVGVVGVMGVAGVAEGKADEGQGKQLRTGSTEEQRCARSLGRGCKVWVGGEGGTTGELGTGEGRRLVEA